MCQFKDSLYYLWLFGCIETLWSATLQVTTFDSANVSNRSHTGNDQKYIRQLTNVHRCLL